MKINPILCQFLQFAGIGLVGTAAHFSTLFVFVHFFYFQVIIASSAGFIIGAIINYFLNYVFTFRSNKKHTEAFSKFFTVALIGLTFNSGLMAINTIILNIHYLIGQIIATGCVLIWNFVGNRLWTFDEKTKSIEK